MMVLCTMILAVASRHRINAPDFDAGHERFVALSGMSVSAQEFQDAVASCVADRLVFDPVRLPEGALQCHWHLEPTEAGRALVATG